MPFLLTAVALAGLLALQTPEFDVSSIRPRPEQPECEIVTGTQIEPGRIRLEYASLADCIALAYRVSRDRIVGPEWLATTRFDIAATLPAGATRRQVPEMMQALLDRRFRLRMHRETRESAGYALLARSEAKLEPATPDPEAADQPLTETLNGSGAGIFVSLPSGAGYTLQKSGFEFRKMTMAMVADALSLFVGRPVVDATAMAGHFNITLEASPDMRILTVRYGASVGVPVPPEALQFANNVSGDTIAPALRRVALSLEAKRLPLEVIVVDSIDREPTDN